MKDSGNASDAPSDPMQRGFATTSWTMVFQAAGAGRDRNAELSANPSGTFADVSSAESADSAALALSELCRGYWFPLYAFVRRKGLDRAEAEDVTQSFFADLLEKKRLENVTPSRGRFRSFLLTSMSNFLANHWRAANAVKRGGGQTVLSIDADAAEDRYVSQAVEELTPEKIFEVNWALSVLEQTLAQVRQQYDSTGKAELFDALQSYLTAGDQVPYDQLAEQTGMKVGSLKVAVHRLRQRYGQQLRLQIARTVDDPSQVDQELAALFDTLG